jgi:hypothetical protein
MYPLNDVCPDALLKDMRQLKLPGSAHSTLPQTKCSPKPRPFTVLPILVVIGARNIYFLVDRRRVQTVVHDSCASPLGWLNRHPQIVEWFLCEIPKDARRLLPGIDVDVAVPEAMSRLSVLCKIDHLTVAQLECAEARP